MNRVLVEPGVSGTTFFAFEDGAVIQIYAERPEGSDTWEVFDGRQFLCRALVMEVENVWRFLDDEARGELRTAEVVSTGTLVVGAGSFTAWRVDVALDSAPGVVGSVGVLEVRYRH